MLWYSGEDWYHPFRSTVLSEIYGWIEGVIGLSGNLPEFEMRRLSFHSRILEPKCTWLYAIGALNFWASCNIFTPKNYQNVHKAWMGHQISLFVRLIHARDVPFNTPLTPYVHHVQDALLETHEFRFSNSTKTATIKLRNVCVTSSRYCSQLICHPV